MAKKDEREAFKQAALKMAKYRLRRALNEAGCTAQEVRDAEVEGEDRMVEILLTKYDENSIDLPGLERATGKSAGSSKKTEEPKRTAKRSAKKKKEEEDDDSDPYSSAFDDDDDDSGSDDSNDDDDSGSDDSDDSNDGEEAVENDEAEPPRRASKSRRKAEGSGGTDLEALEAKVDKVMDLLVTSVEATVELSEKFDAFVNQHIEFEEITKFAFARIWKLGAANPLKPGFGDVISKAKEIAAKRIGQEED